MIKDYIYAAQLLPDVARARVQLCPDPRDGFSAFRRAVVQLEFLPYALGSASYALFAFVRAQHAVIQLKVSQEKVNTVNELQPEDRDVLGFFVDLFLDSMRKAQNGVIQYIQRKHHDSLPASLSALANGIESGKFRLQPDVSTLVLEYWHAHGRKLKCYRDLAQHHAIVSGEARVYIPPTGPPALFVPLPNNPEVKSVHKLQYEDPQVHAQEYMVDQLLHVVRFSREVAQCLLDKGDGRRMEFCFGIRAGLLIGSPTTTYIVPQGPEEIKALILDLLSDAAGRSGEPAQPHNNASQLTAGNRELVIDSDEREVAGGS